MNKKHLRELAASPVYFAAFVMHLLCAALTTAADWISGEPGQNPLVPHWIVAATGSMPMAFLFMVSNIAFATLGWYVALPPQRDTARYVVMERSTEWDATTANFTTEQMVWVPGSIILNGCLFAQEAIKFNYRDHPIGFDPCHSERRDIKLSADFHDLSMALAATVDGKPASFGVKLQHYPPATGEQGYRLLALKQLVTKPE